MDTTPLEAEWREKQMEEDEIVDENSGELIDRPLWHEESMSREELLKMRETGGEKKEGRIEWNIVLLGALIVVLLIAVLVFMPRKEAEGIGSTQLQKPDNNTRDYWVERSGIIHYRVGEQNYTGEFLYQREGIVAEKVVYESRGARIYGLLLTPKSPHKTAVLLLPGAGVRKEDEKLAWVLAKNNYTVLTIDQRGIGETDGEVESIDEEYKLFVSGKEPTLHKMVYDAIAAKEVLKKRGHAVIVMGESMGGRFAIIAGAVDADFVGVVGISTSGYEFGESLIGSAETFANSINPDTYVMRISPRPFAMFHSSKDRVVPITSAKNTFRKAGEPNAFYEFACDTHGYCDEMNETLMGWLLLFD
ncbi:MAG: alpha/beta fold hydrolase [Candidatus Micrarchaeia archaeon]